MQDVLTEKSLLELGDWGEKEQPCRAAAREPRWGSCRPGTMTEVWVPSQEGQSC